MSQTYSDVDRSRDPAGAVEWQVRMAGWPAVLAYKKRTYELLGSAARVLDVGCGPGVDAAARGWTGAEPSAVMAAAAAGRGVVVCRGDAQRLPFAAGRFDGVRADRVFQHLGDPAAALREIVRVTASGGRIVIVDPDQATLAIRVPGVRPVMLDRLERLRRDVGYRNGTLIAEIPAMMRDQGLAGVSTESFPLVLTDPADAFGLPTWPETWRTEGGFTDDELAEWHAVMQERPLPGFSYQVSFKVVVGTKP